MVYLLYLIFWKCGATKEYEQEMNMVNESQWQGV